MEVPPSALNSYHERSTPSHSNSHDIHTTSLANKGKESVPLSRPIRLTLYLELLKHDMNNLKMTKRKWAASYIKLYVDFTL